MATIKKIRIDKDTDWMTMTVICDKCKGEDDHAISYISRITDDEIVIDFASTDDYRKCEGYVWTESTDPNLATTKCNAVYNLCNIKLPTRTDTTVPQPCRPVEQKEPTKEVPRSPDTDSLIQTQQARISELTELNRTLVHHFTMAQYHTALACMPHEKLEMFSKNHTR